MQQNSIANDISYPDEKLIEDFPGFTNGYAKVNGVKLHYVDGGSGEPLLCLPGWPQTWYSYRPIALELAKTHRVIIVDIRGMGTSEKPESGFDKKNMAQDIVELIKILNLEQVNIIGHDIGGMVAMSLAFNFPQYIKKLIVADGIHPNEGMMHMALLPTAGTFGEKMDANLPYAWWMGFNQVKGLPELILEGRFRYLIDWLFRYVMIDESLMSEKECAIYAAAYNDKESIRASNAWYQSFITDIEDAKSYQPLLMPVLGIGSYVSYNYMKMALPYVCKNLEMAGMTESGHYLFEECPEAVIATVNEFLKK
ncbi:alpha/beta hydrolase [Pedobacter sp. Leaf216]|uniref:alpha/beta fold hydrolase n=1 Tax=Pedobacter sp. Leaf216 TaxID=1735684 RepID=UPI0006FC5EB1|nr:alpha/beta hydrolase [Pedobacter sp. Leaf216]KQM73034.1 alpha/beta hydrolase [Pedobacter sp. Leaf216]